MNIIYLIISHFLVDFHCIYLLNSVVAASQVSFSDTLVFALLYNGIAFAFQLPIGTAADKIEKNKLFTVAGMLLAAAGAFISDNWLLCIVIGTGNAFFHIGGGREALFIGRGKDFSIGKFVSSGAMGVFLAGRFFNIGFIKAVSCVSLLVFAFLIFLGGTAEKYVCQKRVGRARFIKAAVYMFLTVLLRAYMGSALKYSFQSVFVSALLFAFSVVCGKFFGGYLCDVFGRKRFSVISQLFCVLCFALSFINPIFAFAAVFLWNTTMAPAANMLFCGRPEYAGMMFGLTTLALFIGTSLNQTGLLSFEMNAVNASVISLISAILFVRGIFVFEGALNDKLT